MEEKIILLLKLFFNDKYDGFDDKKIKALIDFTQSKRPSCLSKEQQDEAQINYIIFLILEMGADGNNVDMSKVSSMSIGEQSISFKSNIALAPSSSTYWLKKWADLNKLCSMGSILITKNKKRCCCG